MKPLLKEVGIIQCNLHRDTSGLNKLHPMYTLTHASNKDMIAAKKQSFNRCANYWVSLDPENFDKESDEYLGKLKSNFLGSEFRIYDSKLNPGKTEEPD